LGLSLSNNFINPVATGRLEIVVGGTLPPQRVLPLNLVDHETVSRLCHLQQQAYRVEAALIGFAGIPPLFETLNKLKAVKETFYGISLGDTLAGAIACDYRDKSLDITRLMVNPKFFRQGIAQTLPDFIEQRYSSCAITRVTTGSDNEPAIQLYLKNGFSIIETTPIAPGVFLIHLAKQGG
jgi:GNAT superfamily N-acetyltransferase